MMVIPIVVGAHGPLPKGLEKRLEEKEITEIIETIWTKALLRLTIILGISKTCHSDSGERPPVNAGVKNS